MWRFVEADADIEDAAEATDLNVYSDSDWAGDKRSRRSTSGGVAVIAKGSIKSWSSTQGTIALSVGEAEYYAMVTAAAEGLALVALGNDLGFKFRLTLWVDSNAAKAISSRLGLGRVRHMEVKFLWAQEALRMKRFEVRKVLGTKNPADVMTKPMSAKEMQEKLAEVGAKLIRRTCQEPYAKRSSWADWTEEEFGSPA